MRRIARDFGAERRLSPRELQIVELASTGISSKEIAAALRCSTPTIYTHWARIYAKLSCHSREQAVAIFFDFALKNAARAERPGPIRDACENQIVSQGL